MANDPLNPQLGGNVDASSLVAPAERRYSDPNQAVDRQEELFKIAQSGQPSERVQLLTALGPTIAKAGAQIYREYGDNQMLELEAARTANIQRSAADINAQQSQLQADISTSADLRRDAAGDLNNLSSDDRQWLQNFDKTLGTRLRAYEQGNLQKSALDAAMRVSYSNAIQERPWLKDRLSTQFQMATGARGPSTSRTMQASQQQQSSIIEATKKVYGSNYTPEQLNHVQSMVQLNEASKLGATSIAMANTQTTINTETSYEILDNRWLTIANERDGLENDQIKSAITDSANLRQHQKTLYQRKLADLKQKFNIVPDAQTIRDTYDYIDKQHEDFVTTIKSRDIVHTLEARAATRDALLKNGAFEKAKLSSELVRNLGPYASTFMAQDVSRFNADPAHFRSITSLSGLPENTDVPTVTGLVYQGMAQLGQLDTVPGFEKVENYYLTGMMKSAPNPEKDLTPEMVKKQIMNTTKMAINMDPMDSHSFFNVYGQNNNMGRSINSQGNEAVQLFNQAVSSVEAPMFSEIFERVNSGQGLDIEIDDANQSITVYRSIPKTAQAALNSSAFGGFGSTSKGGKVKDVILSRNLTADFKMRSQPTYMTMMNDTLVQWKRNLKELFKPVPLDEE